MSYVQREAIAVVTAAGGNAKNATFHITLE